MSEPGRRNPYRVPLIQFVWDWNVSSDREAMIREAPVYTGGDGLILPAIACGGTRPRGSGRRPRPTLGEAPPAPDTRCPIRGHGRRLVRTLAPTRSGAHHMRVPPSLVPPPPARQRHPGLVAALGLT